MEPKAVMGPAGARRRVGSGPPLLCFMSLVLTPVDGPWVPRPALPAHYFPACLLPPGVLVTQRVEGTDVTAPGCKVSALGGRRAHQTPFCHLPPGLGTPSPGVWDHTCLHCPQLPSSPGPGSPESGAFFSPTPNVLLAGSGAKNGVREDLTGGARRAEGPGAILA